MSFDEYCRREKIIRNNINLREKLKIPLEQRTQLSQEQLQGLAHQCRSQFAIPLIGNLHCGLAYGYELPQCPYLSAQPDDDGFYTCKYDESFKQKNGGFFVPNYYSKKYN